MSNQNASGSRRPRFLKPNDSGPGFYGQSERACLQDRAGTSEPDEAYTPAHHNPFQSISLQQQRTRLPIFKYRNHILYLLEKYQTLVLVGETGSGKSTQLPQYLMECGWANQGLMIAVTQPRRVAVVTLANRVSEECSSVLGQEVGYAVRFDDCTTQHTKIKYMTDGLLIREIMADPLLTNYSCVMVDEAHERSVQTDLLCALLRKILIQRPELKVVVSSATLDAQLFVDYFNVNEKEPTSTAITVQGRQHPVQILYSKLACADYMTATVTACMQIHKLPQPGDILIFLTGMDEVESMCNRLRDESKGMRNVDRLWIVPLYGALTPKEQLKAFDSTPAGTRKIVVATNVAEASVTIPGVVFEESFLRLRESTVPEMQRCWLGPVLLQLKALGVDNLVKFNYISRPSSTALVSGVEQLQALGAFDTQGMLTELGTRMAEFPLPPLHAKALFTAGEPDFACTEEMSVILAMLQIQNVFMFPAGNKHKAEVAKRKFSVAEGDHLSLLNVYNAFETNGRSARWCSENFVNHRGLVRATEIRAQLIRLLKHYKIPIVSAKRSADGSMRVRKCVCAGLFPNAARLDSRAAVYKTVRHNYPLRIHKGSAIMYRTDFPQCYDMVHFGHANSLRQAKGMGQYLIVGVHTDAEISKHKGPPVFNEQERYTMVRNIKWVDEVVEGAPYVTTVDTLDKHDCAFCVHGDDITLTADGQDTYSEVKGAGRYKECSRTAGISTTDLVGRMLLLTREHHSQQNKDMQENTEKLGQDKLALSPWTRVTQFFPTSRVIQQFSQGRKPNPDDRIVYVCGAFDLFHIGHLRFVLEAAKQGDYLVVGLHDDATVNAYRGSNHPIMTLHERVLAVLAYKPVSEVVLGAPYSVTEAVMSHFNVHVVCHGHSNQVPMDPVTGEDPYAVPKAQGKFKVIDSGDTMTTDGIIQRIIEHRLQFESRNEKKEAKEAAVWKLMQQQKAKDLENGDTK